MTLSAMVPLVLDVVRLPLQLQGVERSDGEDWLGVEPERKRKTACVTFGVEEEGDDCEVRGVVSERLWRRGFSEEV